MSAPDSVLPVGTIIDWCIVSDGRLVNEVFYVQDWDSLPTAVPDEYE